MMIEDLIDLISSADYCGRSVLLRLAVQKIRRSQDLYRTEPFSWDTVKASEASVLVFQKASRTVDRHNNDDNFPTTDAHLRRELRLRKKSSMIDFIRSSAEADHEEAGYGPSDQCTLYIRSYRTLLSLPQNEGYVFPMEIWGQAGSRESAMHADHGRSVAFLPPFLTKAFKLWVFFRTEKDAKRIRTRNTADCVNRMLNDPLSCVVVQQPGDVVYVSMLVYHAVLVGYNPHTKEEDKWCMIGGNVVLFREDRHLAARYASQLTIGVCKGSKEGWMRVLPAFVSMGGRTWVGSDFEEEKRRVLDKLRLVKSFSVHSANVHSRYEKKRKRAAIAAAARNAKKKSA